MNLEIEQKFLVDRNLLEFPERSICIVQGYLNDDPVTRIRCMTGTCKQAFLTIKSKRKGISCLEFEYEIPYEDAIVILQMTTKIVEKQRYEIWYDGFAWEVDVFSGVNEGLIIAEIELPDENTNFKLPKWIITEVSSDSRYNNSNLANHPYTTW